ncbi:MAG: tetratricopeptide repeat protein [Anaerolineae bacterium]
MIDRLRLFLGPARLRALFLLIAGTGLASLILNAFASDNENIRVFQLILAAVAVFGATAIVLGRMQAQDRGRWLLILAPAYGLIIIGIVVLPQFGLAFFGGAVGWIVAGTFIFRVRTPPGYRIAVKALRKGDMAGAVAAMDQVIKDDSDDPAHYRFRAELLRIWGKLDRARRDYQKMIELDPNSAEAWNGLAEVGLQAGDFEHAHEAALKAAELAPEDWVALYNLGMIEDRLKDSPAVIEHLTHAVQRKVPEVRHRLLIYLYLTRAAARLDDTTRAEAWLDDLRHQRSGLEEWEKILEHEEAATLRSVLGADVDTASALLDGRMKLDKLGEAG